MNIGVIRERSSLRCRPMGALTGDVEPAHGSPVGRSRREPARAAAPPKPGVHCRGPDRFLFPIPTL